MTWWKSVKCAGCGRKIKKGEPLSVLEINTTDGVIEMEVCKPCGDFWEASQKVIQSQNISSRNTGEDDD